VAYSLFLINPADYPNEKLRDRRHEYIEGVQINAEMLPHMHPGWSMIVYHDDSVPMELLVWLADRGVILERVAHRSDLFTGAFWRFSAAADPRFDRVLIRDVDQLVTPRQVDAVADWLASDEPFHVMRWHKSSPPERPMQAGMWGAVVGELPELLDDMAVYPRYHKRFDDEFFLRRHVFSHIESRCVIHDEAIRGGATHLYRVGVQAGHTVPNASEACRTGQLAEICPAMKGFKPRREWQMSTPSPVSPPARRSVKVFQFQNVRNVGDTLSLSLLRHFRPDLEFSPVERAEGAKLLACGSLIVNELTQVDDIVWGAGARWPGNSWSAPYGIRALAVRGPLTREKFEINGRDCAEVYGDPALLLPLLYKPASSPKSFSVGYIPHYIDRNEFRRTGLREGTPESIEIDVYLPWKRFVDHILACERVVSSSLHGVIIAEAYGVAAEWRPWSDKVEGGDFKFHDYLLGTGREAQGPGEFPPIPDLGAIQRGLIEALQHLPT
jgi:pyruvyltransferase